MQAISAWLTIARFPFPMHSRPLVVGALGVAQTLAWLQREGRVSYRALRLEFDLNDDVLDALKEELITVKELAIEKDGKMLVWVGPGINGKKDKWINGREEKNTKITLEILLPFLHFPVYPYYPYSCVER